MNRVMLLSLFLGIFSIQLRAQSTQTWTTYQETDQIKIEYAESECSPAGNDIKAKYYIFKVTNKTSIEVTVSWELNAYYNGECRTCNNSEYTYQSKISADGFIQGNCGVSANPALTLFREWINNRHSKTNEKLTRFELINIRVQ